MATVQLSSVYWDQEAAPYAEFDPENPLNEAWDESEEVEEGLFDELFAIVDEAELRMEELVAIVQKIDQMVLDGWSYDEAKFAVAYNCLSDYRSAEIDDLYDRYCCGEYDLYGNGDGTSEYHEGTIVEFS